MPIDATRVEELVEAALEKEPNEWPSFLDEACPDDPNLRAEVASLLGYQEKVTSFIEAPAYQAHAEFFADDTGELKEGEYLGEYKILALLGEGGMGEVYLAEDEALGRKVAIKLVKLGLNRANLIRHFRQEERILAGLNDPHIARLYGGAVSANGVPYFVMEYVEGERVDDYCKNHQLNIPQRIQLFRKVCAAVSYAHQRLVIHRDLKPANIRVTTEGEPKLLDFGIAKVLDDQTTQAFEQTITLAGVMTPDYASPEQILGEPMTTASDTYSLGVILYELLTGGKPYKITSRTPAELSRAITEQEPPRPSVVVANTAKGSRDNPKLLRGDLDNIVLMAMRKEASRRYISVAQFSDDLRRYLEGMPVVAHKDSLSYRGAKFIRRHRLGALAALLLLLAIGGGVIATIWQARVAQKERAKAQDLFNDVRQLANSFMFEFHDSIQDLPGATAARALVVKRALEYLDRLSKKSEGDISLERELATAYLKVGNAQGNPTSSNLGDTAGAMQSYRKGLNILENLSPKDMDAPTRQTLGMIYQKIGDLEAATGKISAAVKSAERSLAIYSELAQTIPNELDATRSLGVSYIKLGDVLGNPNFPNAGEAKGAVENYQQSLKILNQLTTSHPDDQKTKRFLGIIFERIGTMKEMEEDIPSALESYRKSLEIRETLAAEQPNNNDVLRDTAIAHEKLANVLTLQNELSNARAEREKSLDIFRELLAADPRDVRAHQSLAISYTHLGDLLGYPDTPNLGQLQLARQSYGLALQALETITDSDAASVTTRGTFGSAYERLGTISLVDHKLTEADSYYQMALGFQEAIVKEDPANRDAKSELATLYFKLGQLHATNSSTVERSCEWFQKSYRLWSDLGRQGEFKRAEAAIAQSVQVQLLNSCP